MVALSEFLLYLDSILTPSQRDQDWKDHYIQTLAELPLQAGTCTRLQTASKEGYEEKREQLAVIEGLRKYAPEQVLLVGKPGSGKSTALRRLLLEEAERCMQAIKQDKSEIPLIPILIKLDSLGDSVLVAIEKKLKLWLDLDEKALSSLLHNRQVLVLLDGLNELPSSASWKAVEEFRQLCLQLKVPLVCTTRELDSGSGLAIDRKLEMLPLTKSQMQRLVHKRLPETGRKLLQQIQGQQQMQGQLRELAETPLFWQAIPPQRLNIGTVPKSG